MPRLGIHARIRLTGIALPVALLGRIRLLTIPLIRHLLSLRGSALRGIIVTALPLPLPVARGRTIISSLALGIAIGRLSLGCAALGRISLGIPLRGIALGRLPLGRIIALRRLTGIAALRRITLTWLRHSLSRLLTARGLLIIGVSVIHPCPFTFPPSRKNDGTVLDFVLHSWPQTFFDCVARVTL